MFGKYNVKEIVEGWKNQILGKEEELYQSRIKICRKCPLYTADSVIGEKCDPNKYYSTVTGELVDGPGENVIRGCGCALKAKGRNKDSHCIINKW